MREQNEARQRSNDRTKPVLGRGVQRGQHCSGYSGFATFGQLVFYDAKAQDHDDDNA
ncbi:hypothetical protein D3C76_1820770 [compost metagenome]